MAKVSKRFKGIQEKVEDRLYGFGEGVALAKELGFDQRISYPSRGFVHLGWRRD